MVFELEITQINRLLKELAERHAIENFFLNDEGTASLQLKSGVQLFFEYVPATRMLYVYTPLMPLPEHEARRHALYELMLSRNFLNGESPAGILAICLRKHEAICETGMALANLDVDIIENTLNRLVAQREEVLCLIDRTESGSCEAVARPSALSLKMSTLQRLFSNNTPPSDKASSPSRVIHQRQ